MTSYRDLDPGLAFLQGPIHELANYRVLGVIDHVMLVLDRNTDNTYIMKVNRPNILTLTLENHRHVSLVSLGSEGTFVIALANYAITIFDFFRELRNYRKKCLF